MRILRAEPLMAYAIRQRAASLSRVNLLVARIVIAIPVTLVLVSSHGLSSDPIVTAPPGGVDDALARLLADQIGRAHRQMNMGVLARNKSTVGISHDAFCVLLAATQKEQP